MIINAARERPLEKLVPDQPAAFLKLGTITTGVIMPTKHTTKRCSRCGSVKSISCFSKYKKNKDGLQCSCKTCVKAFFDAKPPHYRLLNTIKSRCYYHGAPNYGLYGARGISVCDRWRDRKNGQKNFFEDMGPRPSKMHQIDRINNDGNYEPSNCRWVTPAENAHNRRDNKLDWEKVRLIRWYRWFAWFELAELAKMFGVGDGQICQIVNNKAWRTEDAPAYLCG